nr:protein kinase-like domain, concanavalin A-like lectin/glucanase domain protein [Tanacetum cinerariifolium]
MGDANSIHTFGDYSKPSHEGYRNTVELPIGNNVVPLRSDTIRLMQTDAHSTDLDLALYDNESWNDPRDFVKPVKAISLPQDVLSTSDHRFIELKNQVQCLMEAHLAPMQPTQVNKITTSWPNSDADVIECLDVEGPLDLVDTSEESVYESLIKEMPKCSLSYDFKIKKGNPRNLKIPFMIGHRFTANAYIDVDLPMNIMSFSYYNSVRKNGYEYMGRNFVGLGRDMYVIIGNMSYVTDFTILKNIKTNINPSLSHVIFGRPFVEIACLAINRKYGLMTYMDGIKEITFKTPYKDTYRSEFSSEGHDLLPSRVILDEDDYDRGCRKPSDLEDGFYRDTIKLGPEYLTGMNDEGEVT